MPFRGGVGIVLHLFMSRIYQRVELLGKNLSVCFFKLIKDVQNKYEGKCIKLTRQDI